MSEQYFDMFDKNRNLIPIMSIEGEKDATDSRRGDGVYDKLVSNMDELQKEGVLLDDHDGGCVLYEKRQEVEALLKCESWKRR